MSSIGIRDELYNMKMKMETLEEELSKQLAEAEEKYKKWNEIDKEVEEMRQNAMDIITLNVGGKIFQTKIDTLLSICLLYTSPSPRDRQKSRMPSSA